MRALPPGPRYSLWAAGGAVWYTLSRGQRRAALDNYSAVLGFPRDDPRVAHTARAAFRNYGKMLADFLLIGSNVFAGGSFFDRSDVAWLGKPAVGTITTCPSALTSG